MRYPALESLRGLAALVVVIHHHLLVFPALYPYRVGAAGLAGALLHTPLHLLWAGGEAVLLFFVLSGFVLSLASWSGQPLDMPTFITRRLWRIWVPFMAAVTVAYAAGLLIGTAPVSGVSVWFSAIWQGASPMAYLQHMLMLGAMDTLNGAFIPVVWSLKWEMWGSLLIPLVTLLARQSTLIVLGACTLLIALHWQLGGGTDIATGLMRYLPMFVIGALIARHRAAVAVWIAARPSPFRVALLAAALLLMPVAWYGSAEVTVPRQVLDDLGVVLAAGVLIALSLGWPGFQRWLERPALLWLGRVSFSLYLYHTLVLTITVRLGQTLLPLPALLPISAGLTFLVAHLAHRFIEVPAMAYGKQITRPAQPPRLTELTASKRPDDLSLSFTRRNTPPKP